MGVSWNSTHCPLRQKVFWEAFNKPSALCSSNFQQWARDTKHDHIHHRDWPFFHFQSARMKCRGRCLQSIAPPTQRRIRRRFFCRFFVEKMRWKLKTFSLSMCISRRAHRYHFVQYITRLQHFAFGYKSFFLMLQYASFAILRHLLGVQTNSEQQECFLVFVKFPFKCVLIYYRLN